MSCCKANNNFKKEINDKPSNLIARLFQFMVVVILTLITSPVIMVIVLIMIFKSIVLNKKNDLTSILSSIMVVKNKMNKKTPDLDESEDFDVDDYEIIGLEKIKKE